MGFGGRGNRALRPPARHSRRAFGTADRCPLSLEARWRRAAGRQIWPGLPRPAKPLRRPPPGATFGFPGADSVAAGQRAPD